MEQTPPQKNAHFATQLLEKIGAPLLSVIESVADESSDEQGQIEQAQTMAQLLSQTVAMSNMLYNTLDMKEDETMADQTRVALASIVSPFIAEFYLKRKKVPAEDNLKRMLKSLEAVLMFGENFKPASGEKSRLQTLGQRGVLFDKNQPVLVSIQAMVPVVNAIEEFSFGKSRRKLVQDIANRLEAKASEIAKTQNHDDKLTELLIFKSLASLYADCHRSETRRVLEDVDKTRDNLSVDGIWEKFDVKVQMMEALLGIVAENAQSASAGGGDVAPEVTPPVEQEVSSATAEVAPAEAPPIPPVTSPPPAQPAAAPTSAGPMGFFKKGDDAQAAAPQETPAAAAAPAPASTEQAPAATPPPAETPPPSSPPADGNSSPMGFFKKPKEGE